MTMSTVPKRDWLQISINVAIAAGCVFMAYNAIRYPRTALMVLLTLAGTMAFVGVVSLVFQLIAKLVGRPLAKAWRSERADKIRLRLLGKAWLAARFPSLWDWLREEVRRHRCCEMSDCWNEPTCTWDEHKVCAEHYAEIAKIAAADRVGS